MNQKIQILIFVVLAVLVGFIRETFFVRIGWNEFRLTDNTFAPESFPLLGFLDSLNAKQLLYSRYLGTFFFTVIFWLLTILMVKWFFPDKSNYRIAHLVFFCVFVLSAILHLISMPLGLHLSVFPIARWMMHCLETPLILLLLLPAFYWVKNS